VCPFYFGACFASYPIPKGYYLMGGERHMEPAVTVEEVYERYIRRLTPQQKQQLMEKIAQDLATPKLGQADSNPSLLDLAGLGAEVWQGMDAQQYVDQLRAEWDK
jgi:hypothetical protein